MGSRSLGLVLLFAGLGLAAVGLLVWQGGLGWLSWLGRLPGDIRIEREGFRLYVPITSMLLISVALTLILSFVRRFLG